MKGKGEPWDLEGMKKECWHAYQVCRLPSRAEEDQVRRIPDPRRPRSPALSGCPWPCKSGWQGEALNIRDDTLPASMVRLENHYRTQSLSPFAGFLSAGAWHGECACRCLAIALVLVAPLVHDGERIKVML